MKTEKLLLPLASGQSLDQRILSTIDHLKKAVVSCTLLTVIDDLSFTGFSFEGASSNLQLLDFVEKREKDRLDEIKLDLNEKFPDIRFDVEIEVGPAFVKIIEVAQTIDANLIIIDANRGNKKHAAQFGSTTRHLMRKSQIPVWTLSPEPKANGIRSVVAAIDVSDLDSMTRSLNEKILDAAIDLAISLETSLTVLHAWQLPGEHYLKGWANYSDLEIAQLAKKERERRLDEVKSVIDALHKGFDKIEIRLVEGRPEIKIPEYIEQQHCDLLVMGTVCRTGIPGFIIGNSAESMLDTVSCSVVTLKPDEFKSPVTHGAVALK